MSETAKSKHTDKAAIGVTGAQKPLFVSRVIEAVENDPDQSETFKSKHNGVAAIGVCNVKDVRIHRPIAAVKSTELTHTSSWRKWISG